MKLKSIIYALLTTLLFVGLIFPTKKAVIKSIVQSEQSTRNSERISRDVALADNVDLIERYNKAVKLESYTRYNPDGSIYESTAIIWTEDSLSQTLTTVNAEGELIRIWKTVWESPGKLIGATNTNADGIVTTIQTNSYDDSGNMIQRKMESPENEKISITDFIYDSEGHVIEETEYNPYRDQTDKRTYQYDDKGRESVQELFNGNGDYTKFVSEYDQMDNILEMYWYDKAGVQTDKTSFTYEYDSNGNWTTKTRGSNGKVTYISERKIEYW
jgi:hypothetical protein